MSDNDAEFEENIHGTKYSFTCFLFFFLRAKLKNIAGTYYTIDFSTSFSTSSYSSVKIRSNITTPDLIPIVTAPVSWSSPSIIYLFGGSEGVEYGGRKSDGSINWVLGQFTTVPPQMYQLDIASGKWTSVNQQAQGRQYTSSAQDNQGILYALGGLRTSNNDPGVPSRKDSGYRNVGVQYHKPDRHYFATNWI